MKKLIFILSFFLLNSAYAQNTNLLCDITLRENNGGRFTNQKIITRVEVSVLQNGNIFIIPDSNLLNPVSTAKTPSTVDFTNYSTSTKWHIEKTTKNQTSGINTSTTIIIDRNVGTISYNDLYMSNNAIQTTGFGNCEKIDPNKKKF